MSYWVTFKEINLHNNCDINISKNTDILGHIKSSRGDMPYQCKQGEKFFSNDYALKNTWAFTMKRRHVNAVRVTRLSRIAVILKAMWKYTQKKPWQCEKAFSNTGDHKIHVMIHTVYHNKSNCDKAFSKNCDLKRYFRIHTGNKPYQCNQCDKRFSNNSDLIRHTMIHTVEKPFQCS